jgi:hypothetical protein
MPAILNDIGDWVEATRVKSVELLYIMIWQAERNITQHLETVMQTLFKASSENLPLIQANLFNCAKLLGHFTDADITLNFTFKAIRKLNSPNHGSINILNGLLVGFGQFYSKFNLIIDTLNLLNQISLTLDVNFLKFLLWSWLFGLLFKNINQIK